MHPAPGHYSHTLVNAVMYHCGDQLSGINGVLRPGIVHRIDMDTTGSLLVCKNDRAHQILAEELKEHSITRRYHAIVCGNIKTDKVQWTLRSEGILWIAENEYKSPQMEGVQLRIIKCLNVSEITHISSVNWKPEEHTRSVCIWQVLVIRYWEMRYMVRQNVHTGFRVRRFMQKTRNYASFNRRIYGIRCSAAGVFFRSSGKTEKKIITFHCNTFNL